MMTDTCKVLATKAARVLLASSLCLSFCGLAGCATAESPEPTSQEAVEEETDVVAGGDVDEDAPPSTDELEKLLDAERLEEVDSAESASTDEAGAPAEEWELPDEIVFDQDDSSDAEGDDVSKARTMPNLNNASDQRALNVFLSNFTEAGMGLSNRNGYVFNRYRASAQEYAHLAFWHYYQNGGRLEEGSWRLGNVRVKASKLDAVTDYLTGRVVTNWASLNNTEGWYRYKDGYVYTEVTGGRWMCGPAVAVYARSNGDGYLRVGFDGYYQDSAQTGYSVGDGSQYSMSESQLNRLLGVSGPNGYGTAIIDYWWADGKWNFRLVSLVVFIS